MRNWLKKGEHWIWFSASTVSISLVLVFGLLAMISYKGLIHFWPHSVYQFEVKHENAPNEIIVGELSDSKIRTILTGEGAHQVKREVPQYLIKMGNRDVYGIDFRWLSADDLVGGTEQRAKDVVVIERYEYGNVYGQLASLEVNGTKITDANTIRERLASQVELATEIRSDAKYLEKIVIGGINAQIDGLRLDAKKLVEKNRLTPSAKADFEAQRLVLQQAFEAEQVKTQKLYQQLENLGQVTLKISNGQEMIVPVRKIVHFWQPNNMRVTEQVGFFFNAMGNFLMDDPREANTEGGVFPAIIGTITMVLLMTVFVTPMGVIAAIYMREYAKEGMVLRLVRISINNLAGVPSIVFGIFGLGFFVYILGGSIDELFYSYALPNPTFGTPGLLWASLTMALLTLPVVIVSTEEGLSRVPRALREGGLALGATKAETIVRIVLPMATPAIMTGLILAIARAAGEVAPLMLVGVVKLAPELPLDMVTPFIHLERKFMHLGFHIYDVGFQSPNVEASQPLVYATSLLLVIIIVALNLGAITIRNRLREKYKGLES